MKLMAAIFFFMVFSGCTASRDNNRIEFLEAKLGELENEIDSLKHDVEEAKNAAEEAETKADDCDSRLDTLELFSS